MLHQIIGQEHLRLVAETHANTCQFQVATIVVKRPCLCWISINLNVPIQAQLVLNRLEHSILLHFLPR